MRRTLPTNHTRFHGRRITWATGLLGIYLTHGRKTNKNEVHETIQAKKMEGVAKSNLSLKNGRGWQALTAATILTIGCFEVTL